MSPHHWFIPSHLRPLDSIPLGSLVSNLRTPHKENLPPEPKAQLPDDIVTTPLKNLDLFLSLTQSCAPLHIRLTQLLSFTHDNFCDVQSKVKAKASFDHELRQPKAFFQQLRKNAKAREWMQTGIEDGYGTYFVTGLRTVVDGKFEYGNFKSRSNTFESKIPLLSTTLPADQRPFGSIGGSTGRTQDAVRSEVWEAPGEQIFAVAYRKVNFRSTIVSRSNVDAARLKGEDVWVLLPDHRDTVEPDEVEIVQDVYLEGEDGQEEATIDCGEATWGLTSIVVGQEKWMFGEDDDEAGEEGDEEELEEEW